jgi:hypothetical protein
VSGVELVWNQGRPFYRSTEGLRYASISQVLRDVGIKKSFDGKVSQAVLDHAAWRGKAVEKHCFEIARKGWTDCPEEVEIWDRVAAFELWWRESGAEYVSHHEIVWDDVVRVAHELDLVCRLEGRLTTIDIKCTASVEKDWGIQCGAQATMRSHMTGDGHNLAVLHIKPAFKKGFIYRLYGAESCEAWHEAREARLESLKSFARAKKNIEELL